MSASSRGGEREIFVSHFLRHVLPPIYRFGSGDATDRTGQKSGQLDIVIEYPFGPSLPAVSSSDIRLYLAETVAAVVEVKSNLASQWTEVEHTASELSRLNRDLQHTMHMGRRVPVKIPLIAVGFKGWQTIKTLKRRLEETPFVAGILVLDSQLFLSREPFVRGAEETGDFALWAMISIMYETIASLQAAITNPFAYAEEFVSLPLK